MKIDMMAIKRTLSMFGFDFDSIFEQAIPAITKRIDAELDEITINDGESKGLLIVADEKGEYHIVKTKFKENANQYMENVGHYKLSSLLTTIINSIKNG